MQSMKMFGLDTRKAGMCSIIFCFGSMLPLLSCLVGLQLIIMTAVHQITSLECRLTRKAPEYRGTLSHTASGRPCQPWSAQTPHRHPHRQGWMFPDGGEASPGGYCRNPGGVRARPWCFTEERGVPWEYCHLPMCGCRTTQAGREYRGGVSRTRGGLRCQRWDAQTPHAHPYSRASPSDGLFPDESVSHAENHCRNPDASEPAGPWCYTADRRVRWDFCDVPFCECKTTRAGTEYSGRISSTLSGTDCQRWGAQTPHTHPYRYPATLLAGRLEEVANYCRNPGGPGGLGGPWGEGPWCLTMDPARRWDLCDVPYCTKELTQDDHLEDEMANHSVGSSPAYKQAALDVRVQYPALSPPDPPISPAVPLLFSLTFGVLLALGFLLLAAAILWAWRTSAGFGNRSGRNSTFPKSRITLANSQSNSAPTHDTIEEDDDDDSSFISMRSSSKFRKVFSTSEEFHRSAMQSENRRNRGESRVCKSTNTQSEKSTDIQPKKLHKKGTNPAKKCPSNTSRFECYSLFPDSKLSPTSRNNPRGAQTLPGMKHEESCSGFHQDEDDLLEKMVQPLSLREPSGEDGLMIVVRTMASRLKLEAEMNHGVLAA